VSTRATSPVVGVVLLTAVAVLAAATVGATVFGTPVEETPPRAAVDLRADPAADRIAVTHAGGDVLAVDRLRVRVSVGGRPLDHQPPVPFFAATGFEAGPTGPFNSAADGRWAAGETAAVRLAGTNGPRLRPGVRVRVAIYSGGYRVATATTRA